MDFLYTLVPVIFSMIFVAAFVVAAVLVIRFSKQQDDVLRRSLLPQQYIWRGLARERYDSLLFANFDFFASRTIVDPSGLEMGEAYGSAGESRLSCLFVTLPHNLGVGHQLILDSQRNNALGVSFYTTTGITSNMEEIRLEGDFSEYFRVFVTPGRQVDALQIVNPKVMEQLKGLSERYDIEISNGRVYLVATIMSLAVQEVRTSLQQDVVRVRDILQDAVTSV